jgi:hypothetical protein
MSQSDSDGEFAPHPIRLQAFSNKEIDQVKLNRISDIIETGESYTTTDGQIVHIRRVLKA